MFHRGFLLLNQAVGFDILLFLSISVKKAPFSKDIDKISKAFYNVGVSAHLSILRKDKILEYLRTRSTASVTELSSLLDVSEVTVRQDLNTLAAEGFLARTRGGAMLSSRSTNEFTFGARVAINADVKQRIGEAGASLINPGDSIILDASTTGLYVVRALLTRRDLHDITIITNGIQTALELVNRPDITTILTGGQLRMTAVSLIGSVAWDMLAGINATIGFFGARGITVEHGLTDVHLQESNVKVKMIERCQQVVGLVDATKFGEVSLISFAPIDKVQRIITDTAAPADQVTDLRARGVNVLLA